MHGKRVEICSEGVSGCILWEMLNLAERNEKQCVSEVFPLFNYNFTLMRHHVLVDDPPFSRRDELLG